MIPYKEHHLARKCFALEARRESTVVRLSAQILEGNEPGLGLFAQFLGEEFAAEVNGSGHEALTAPGDAITPGTRHFGH